MNWKNRKLDKKQGFTIIELLTVMSIIVILFGLLVPAMNLVKRYSRDVKQQAQFHAIDAGLQMFQADIGTYPPSDAMDRDDNGNIINPGNFQFVGATKLAEALLGMDLLGFHTWSNFDADGKSDKVTGTYAPYLYPTPGANPDQDEEYLANLRLRTGPYLDTARISVSTIIRLYPVTEPNGIVICDEYPRVTDRNTGKRVGMPVLYFKANTSNIKHATQDSELPTAADNDNGNIYNYYDNLALFNTPVPGTTTPHPLATGSTTGDGPIGFYNETRNPKMTTMAQPYNSGSYILMSAGGDGLYGTRDDVFNFMKE